MQATIVVSAAIVEDDRVLLVQEGKPASHGLWGLPGGRVEAGEPLEDAAVREVFEETGYHVETVGMTRVLRYISQLGFHCVRFNFVARRIGGEARVDGTEILAMRWFSFGELALLGDDRMRTPAIARAVLADVRDARFFPREIVLDALSAG
ncbi:MAG: NUDIX domain-containing protein [Bacteroidetes bacterium]|nr:NUDIX domain-containing protein [Bacteroidota bacterium]